MPRQPVGNKQFLEGLIATLKVDGSAVTTSYAKAGLDSGAFIATVKKGESADSNLVTIRFNNPLGLVPSVLIQEVTLNCVARVESRTKNEIAIRTLQNNYSSQANDCDFDVFVFGTEGIREGTY